MVIVSVVYDATSSINAKLSSVILMIKIGDGVMQDLMTSLLFLEHSQPVSNNISTLAIQKLFFFFYFTYYLLEHISHLTFYFTVHPIKILLLFFPTLPTNKKTNHFTNLIKLLHGVKLGAKSKSFNINLTWEALVWTSCSSLFVNQHFVQPIGLEIKSHKSE
jgi:hypothetical protein